MLVAPEVDEWIVNPSASDAARVQAAVLLVGADKAREGWNRWYPKAIEEADQRFDHWLARR